MATQVEEPKELEHRWSIEEFKANRGGRVWESETHLTDHYSDESGIEKSRTIEVSTHSDEETIEIRFGGCRRLMSPEEAHMLGRVLLEHAIDSGVDPETWNLRKQEGT